MTALDNIRTHITSCTACSLRSNCRTTPQPIHATNPAKVRYLFVAATPHQDDINGPFQSSDMHKAKQYLKQTGAAAYQMAFMGLVCCPTKSKDGPTDDQYEACGLNRKMQLKAVDPTVVMLCGAEALRWYRPDLKLTRDRGRPFMFNPYHTLPPNPVAIPTFHPAGIRTKDMREAFRSDVKQARWRVVNDVMGRWPYGCTACGGSLYGYDQDGVAWCETHWTGMERPTRSKQPALLAP